jgi:hypothetical protein
MTAVSWAWSAREVCAVTEKRSHQVKDDLGDGTAVTIRADGDLRVFPYV